MKLTEHQLKEIHQRSTLRQRSPECPSADDLYQLLSNSLDKQQRAKLATHLESCSDCSEEFKMARELSQNLTKSTSRITFWQRPELRSLLAAAVIVLALTAGILVTRRTTINSGPPIERGEPSIEFKTEPADNAQLDKAPEQLKWTAIPGVQNYDVVLLNYESSTIANSGSITSTKYVLPQEIRNKLQSGQIYYWRIEYEKAGEKKSKLLHFTIR
jgi:hypothetical protein